MLVSMSDITLRYTKEEDAPFLKTWLDDADIINWFPMDLGPELDDSVRHWIGYARYNCSLTAIDNNIPCGICTLNLMPYRKLMHQCLLSIVVEKNHRSHGVGTLLLNNIIHLAKEQFKMTHLYLEVYQGNPAIHLYKRFGFKETGRQDYFVRLPDGSYIGKIIMERAL